MAVRVEAIQFNHDAAGGSTDALSIRRNAATPATVPEWQHGVSTDAADSPVAYAIEETRGQIVTLRVRFRRTDPNLDSVEIRAVDPAGSPRGCLDALLRALGLIPFLPAPSNNVLGAVRPRSVSFRPDDLTDFETFELDGFRIASAGVGVYETRWQWQYRVGPLEPWQDIDITAHEVFVTLRTPTAPWQQTPLSPGNTQLPWVDVLRHACTWASGASTADDAAARITRAVHDLGPDTIEYDCPGGGSTRYAFPSFNATAFLERLAGGIGNGRYVNCTDCATIVSTFANAVGCDLWQSRMGYFFGLNPLLAIGSSTWQTACNWGAFSYHEVAWEGLCTAEEEVFDACLQVDGDSDPTAPPHSALLPASLRFGEPGDGDYRDRLATPAGRPSCEPQTATRQRRSVF